MLWMLRYAASKSATISSNENATISDCATWKTCSHLSLMIPARVGKSSSGNDHGQELYDNVSLCTMHPHTRVSTQTSVHSDLKYKTR